MGPNSPPPTHRPHPTKLPPLVPWLGVAGKRGVYEPPPPSGVEGDRKIPNMGLVLTPDLATTPWSGVGPPVRGCRNPVGGRDVSSECSPRPRAFRHSVAHTCSEARPPFQPKACWCAAGSPGIPQLYIHVVVGQRNTIQSLGWGRSPPFGDVNPLHTSPASIGNLR